MTRADDDPVPDGRTNQRQEYIARINRVLDHIEHNLGESLQVPQLAWIASFSPFHFHRIFSAFIGEPLHGYIRRKRLEKAASLLLADPTAAVPDIALSCGFAGSAAFSRAFRDQFQMSASEFRKNRERYSKKSKASSQPSDDIGSERAREGMELRVVVRDMPLMHVAYCRHVGPYRGIHHAFAKLFRWAGSRGLLRFPETKTLAVYHDDPEITEEAKLQTSAGITVPENTPVEGEIGKMAVSGGRYAVAHFEITPDRFSESWDRLVRDWMPESGYQPDDRPAYEIYYNIPEDHPEGKFIVDICMPVRRW